MGESNRVGSDMNVSGGQAQRNVQMPGEEAEATGMAPAANDGAADQSNSDARSDEDNDGTDDPKYVGRVLRSAYESIMEESIPNEMLDLLNRLG